MLSAHTAKGEMTMREHIYRAQRVDNKEWVYGYYCRFGWSGQEIDYIIPHYASACTPLEVIPETVGEYTGLTDKNGKKIFEHDVCRIAGHSYTYEVVFEYSHWTFRILSDKVYCYPWFNSHCGERCEVIGTIFDEGERV